jgi:hypothetical protein
MEKKNIFMHFVLLCLNRGESDELLAVPASNPEGSPLCHGRRV